MRLGVRMPVAYIAGHTQAWPESGVTVAQGIWLVVILGAG
jgi:hypothetical protein